MYARTKHCDCPEPNFPNENLISHGLPISNNMEDLDTVPVRPDLKKRIVLIGVGSVTE